MTLSCSSNMGALRIPDCFKVVPHRLHITLYVRLSRCKHLVTGAALVYSAFLMVTAGKEELRPGSSRSATFLYLGAFATHYGTQMWMTLFSGIVLFFNLPRKIFGLVQRHLFPKYFLLNSILGFLKLWIFVLQNPDSTAQRWNLAVCFLCDLIGMIYIVPDMIQTMTDRAKIEEEAGVGQDIVGRFRPGLNLTSSPNYARLHARFRKFHGLCATVNLLAMACNTGHLYFLACKLIDR